MVRTLKGREASRFWDHKWESPQTAEQMTGTNAISEKIELLQRSQPKGFHGRILDVGCGLAPNIQSNRRFSYVGLDVSRVAILGARRGHAYAEFVVGDAAHLPFKDESFDAVFSSEALKVLGRQGPKAIEEMVRVSKRYLLFSVHDSTIASFMPHVQTEKLKYGTVLKSDEFEWFTITSDELKAFLRGQGVKILRTEVHYLSPEGSEEEAKSGRLEVLAKKGR